MAGSKIVPVENFPSNYEVVHVALSNETASSSANPAYTADQYCYYAHTEMVLDSSILLCETADGSNDATIKLVVAATGAFSAATDLTAALAFGTAGTPASFVLVDGTNVIPAGSWIGVEVAGTSTAAGAFVSLRLHSSNLSLTATSYGS